MSEFEIRDEPPRRTAVVHASLPQGELPAFMGRAFGTIFHAVTAAGFIPAGAPFTRYFGFGPDRIECEAGVAIAQPPGMPERSFDGAGEVQPGELPPGPVAVGWHVGPFDTIAQTYGQLLAWVGEQGREPSGAMWEVYMTDPGAEPDPAKWRTQIFVPLA
jgi:effector-binding domain-containing protein